MILGCYAISPFSFQGNKVPRHSRVLEYKSIYYIVCLLFSIPMLRVAMFVQAYCSKKIGA